MVAGVLVLIVVQCVMRGFEEELTRKVIGFQSHLTVAGQGPLPEPDRLMDLMRGFRGKFSRHAEVDSQPNLRAKAEQHLFAVGLAGNHSPPRQPAKEFLGGGAAEHPLGGMKMDAEDLFSPPGKPAAAEIKYFGEFRHNPSVRADREKSKLGRGKGSDILSRWRQS